MDKNAKIRRGKSTTKARLEMMQENRIITIMRIMRTDHYQGKGCQLKTKQTDKE